MQHGKIKIILHYNIIHHSIYIYIYISYIICLYSGCHSGAITDMSLSLVKPLLVTISNVDKSLRMWNYKTREQTFYMSFPSTSELNCVSLHPTGSYMLLTLYGKVRLYAILMNELRLMGELTPRVYITIIYY